MYRVYFLAAGFLVVVFLTAGFLATAFLGAAFLTVLVVFDPAAFAARASCFFLRAALFL